MFQNKGHPNRYTFIQISPPPPPGQFVGVKNNYRNNQSMFQNNTKVTKSVNLHPPPPPSPAHLQ